MAEKAKKQTNPAVIQAVKAVAVLVIICLVCGLLLALCNDLLYISDEDRLERAMKKVYENFKFKEELPVVTESGVNPNATFGRVNRVLLSEDGAYIIEALGKDGYQGGTVTLYVIIGADAKIKGWAVKENDKQSYIDRIPSNAGTTWYVGIDASEDKTLDLVMTGATVSYTSNAIKNAINMATFYYRAAILGSNPEGEARDAVLALLSDNGYSYESLDPLASVKSVIKTALDTETDKLTYLFVGNGDQGKIYAYVYVKDEASKIVVVTNEGKLLTHNLEEEDELIELILSKPIQEITVTGSVKLYTFVSDFTDNGEKEVEYVVTGLKLASYDPNNYVLKVTVKDGVVTVIDFASASGNGFVEGHPEEDDANALMKGLLGATLENIDDKYDQGIVDDSKQPGAGATQSGNIITAAVKAALKDYAARFASND